MRNGPHAFNWEKHVRSLLAAKRLMAGLFIGFALLFTFAGVAAAQSGGSGQSGGCESGGSGQSCSSMSTASSSSSVASTSSSAAVGGRTLPNTGGDLWIPLSFGGATVSLAVAARLLARRNAV